MCLTKEKLTILHFNGTEMISEMGVEIINNMGVFHPHILYLSVSGKITEIHT